jgi:hypothetical protein
MVVSLRVICDALALWGLFSVEVLAVHGQGGAGRRRVHISWLAGEGRTDRVVIEINVAQSITLRCVRISGLSDLGSLVLALWSCLSGLGYLVLAI